jgi:hypothetical protein
VCNVGEGFLIVGSVTSSNPRFAVAPPPGGFPLALGPNACRDLEVVFSPAAAGAQNATLTVVSNDPVDPSVEVEVSAEGTVQDVAVTGSTDFGVVSAWGAGEKTVSVCNPGTCPLSVTSATTTCADFTLVANPFPAVVPPGACLDLVVAFTPTAQGPRSCDLRVTSDDADTPLVVRTLTARTPPWASLHAGLLEPHGSLGGLVSNGSVLNLDFLYPFTPKWAWNVRLGHGRFDGTAGLPDVELDKLAANARFTINPAAPVRLFLEGGLGLYHLDPGAFEGGANLGLGLHVPAGKRFAIEATYNYHDVLTASPGRELSEVQLGLLVSF